MGAMKKSEAWPQSFYPQDRPAIIGMTESICGQMDRKRSVKVSDDEHFIDGVPLLEWGKWRDCTYAGSVTTLLSTMGIGATYEQIMGLSASAFRFALNDEWNPASTMLQVGINSEDNCNRCFGVEVYEIEDRRIRDHQAMCSIRDGIPILICGSRYAPEWGLIAGYQFGQEDPVFYGRSYFDYQGAAKEEVYTSNQYFLADRYPGDYPSNLFRLYNRTCPKRPWAEGVKISLQAAMVMFAQGSTPLYHYGYDAYEFAAAGIENNCYNNLRHHFGALLDARRAAYVYLAECAQRLGSGMHSPLSQASACFKEMFEVLSDVLPYRELYLGKYNDGLTAAQCRKLAKALRRMSELEAAARRPMGELLDGWR